MSGATDAESTLQSNSSAPEHSRAKENSSALIVAVRSECYLQSWHSAVGMRDYAVGAGLPLRQFPLR